MMPTLSRQHLDHSVSAQTGNRSEGAIPPGAPFARMNHWPGQATSLAASPL